MQRYGDEEACCFTLPEICREVSGNTGVMQLIIDDFLSQSHHNDSVRLFCGQAENKDGKLVQTICF